MSRRVVLFLSVALAAGACGDAGEPPAASTPTSVAASSSTTTLPTGAPTTTTVSATTVPIRPTTTVGPPPTVPSNASPFFADQSALTIAESLPIQVSLTVAGNLPTPCHEAQWIVTTGDGRVDVDLFTIADPEDDCIQVLEPAFVAIPLGSFSDGFWQVFLNGEPVADFSAP